MTIDADIAAIRDALAAGPTSGVWHWDSDPVKGDPTGRVRYQVVTIGKTITKVHYSSFEGGPTNAEADAAYIAAVHPERIARLLDALERETASRKAAQIENEALKQRAARARLSLMRELKEQGWTAPYRQWPVKPG